MAEQKAKARASWAGSGETAQETLWFDLRERLGATEFLGYDTEDAEGKIVALVRDGREVAALQAGEQGQLLVNQTPFYAESGGQIGDTGRIEGAAGAWAEVTDVQKKVGELHVHQVRIEKGRLAVGDDVRLVVEGGRRAQLRAHHSATHLLHEALRRELGEHVTQKGSLVAPDRLRFDISHPKPIAPGELRAVEEEVNRRVRMNTPVETRLMSADDAIAAGAMALFGEKYGEEVRVLSMGGTEGERYSVELCGGTHARRTGDIGLFRILSESAVAAGVRRIEAVAGEAAEIFTRRESDLLAEAAGALKVRREELATRLAAMVEERRRLERDLADARRQIALSGSAGPATDSGDARTVAGVKVMGRTLDGVPAKDLKGMADEFKKRIGSGVVALIGIEDGRASAVVGVTEDLVQRLSAVDLVRAGVAVLGGKGGGGRPDMAQGGGPNAAEATAALRAIEAAVADKCAA
jgi:alanyl-tRNA synthetase